MIFIGGNNNKAIKIVPDNGTIVNPIKFGNNNDSAVNVTKIFIGDENNRAVEMYCILSYEYKHKFDNSTSYNDDNVTLYIKQNDISKRDPHKPIQNCIAELTADKFNAVLDRYVASGLPPETYEKYKDDEYYLYRLNNDNAGIKYLLISDNITTISNSFVAMDTDEDGTITYNKCKFKPIDDIFTFQSIEHLVLSTNTRNFNQKINGRIGVFNNCTNLKSIVFHSKESYTVAKECSIKYPNEFYSTHITNFTFSSVNTSDWCCDNAFRNLYDGAYVLIFDSNGPNYTKSLYDDEDQFFNSNSPGIFGLAPFYINSEEYGKYNLVPEGSGSVYRQKNYYALVYRSKMLSNSDSISGDMTISFKNDKRQIYKKNNQDNNFIQVDVDQDRSINFSTYCANFAQNDYIDELIGGI